MGNSITAGGIRADAHHPSDPRMVNSHITIEGNIFFNNSALFSSTVNILTTYIQFSTIRHNNIFTAPYSGICHGYGWGSNDAGGSPAYALRGLYDYQPRYTTPTTMKNNTIDGNLIHNYGFSHTDLGSMYTLSRAPGTLFTNNYAYDSGWFGIYPDEGSSNLTYVNNVCFSNGNWYAPNDWDPLGGTGNNTFLDNWGKSGDATLVNQPDGSGRRGNTFVRNYVRPTVAQTSERAQRAAYRAGVLPGKRRNRPVSNDAGLADGYLAVASGDGGVLTVTLSNFDDAEFSDVVFSVSANGGSSWTLYRCPRRFPRTDLLWLHIVLKELGAMSLSRLLRTTRIPGLESRGLFRLAGVSCWAKGRILIRRYFASLNADDHAGRPGTASVSCPQTQDIASL